MAQKIVIASGKGGVGKSSLTAGLSFALRDLGKRVLAVDCDVGLRSLDLLFCVGDALVFDWGDLSDGRCNAEQALIEKGGVSLLAAPLREEAHTSQQMRDMLSLFDDAFDFILIDAPAGVAEEFRLAASSADRAIVVATADEVCLRSACRAAESLRAEGIPDLRLVLNRFHASAMEHSFLCNVDDSIDRVGVQLLGVVPEDVHVTFCLPKGEPLQKKSPAKTAWSRIARRICGENVPLKL